MLIIDFLQSRGLHVFEEDPCPAFLITSHNLEERQMMIQGDISDDSATGRVVLSLIVFGKHNSAMFDIWPPEARPLSITEGDKIYRCIKKAMHFVSELPDSDLLKRLGKKYLRIPGRVGEPGLLGYHDTHMAEFQQLKVRFAERQKSVQHNRRRAQPVIPEMALYQERLTAVLRIKGFHSLNMGRYDFSCIATPLMMEHGMHVEVSYYDDELETAVHATLELQAGDRTYSFHLFDKNTLAQLLSDYTSGRKSVALLAFLTELNEILVKSSTDDAIMWLKGKAVFVDSYTRENPLPGQEGLFENWQEHNKKVMEHFAAYFEKEAAFVQSNRQRWDSPGSEAVKALGWRIG